MSIGVGKYVVLASAGAGGGIPYYYSLIGNDAANADYTNGTVYSQTVQDDFDINVDGNIFVAGYGDISTSDPNWGSVCRLSLDGSSVEWSYNVRGSSSSNIVYMSCVYVDSNGDIQCAGYNSQPISYSQKFHTAKINATTGALIASGGEQGVQGGTVVSNWPFCMTGFGTGSKSVVGLTMDIGGGAERPGIMSFNSGNMQDDSHRRLSNNTSVTGAEPYKGVYGIASDYPQSTTTRTWAGYWNYGSGNSRWEVQQNSNITTQNWVREIYLNSFTHQLHCLRYDSVNDFLYVSGLSQNFGVSSSRQACLVQLDVSGATPSVNWARVVTDGTTSSGYYTSCDVDSEGNVYLLGSYGSTGGKVSSLTKYNSSGTVQWHRLLTGSPSSWRHYSLKIDPFDQIVISGRTDYTGVNINRGHRIIIRLPSDGSITGTFGDLTIATLSPTTASPTATLSTRTRTMVNDNGGGDVANSTNTSLTRNVTVNQSIS